MQDNSPLLTRLLGRLAALFLAVVAAPALALLPAPADGGPAEEEAQPAEQIIDSTQEAGQDERIAERIEGIFAELPAFSEVDVGVSEGVVTLSGTVPDGDAIARAANIANRVSGVVTVENDLERDLSVEENLSIFGRVADFANGIVEALPLILVALVTALVIGAIGYVVTAPSGFWRRIAPNNFLADLLRSAIRAIFVIGGLVVALDMLGAGALLGAVLGGAGVIGIAMGFAMRDTIENYVASVMLSLRQPFRANDHVLIDTLEGRVIRLTSRATILMTLEGNHLRIPNAQVFKAVITNFTRNPQRRFEFELGVDADDDANAARSTGIDALRRLDFVLDDPEPAARIEAVGDSNVVIRFLAWIDQNEADWFKSRTVAIATTKTALEQAGFALPEPIYRLRFDARTDPLPIGRASVRETDDETPARPAPAPSPSPAPSDTDVSPETEIATMVEKERSGDDEQANDLLDTSRPVE